MLAQSLTTAVSLRFHEGRTYLFASLFVVGNVLLPQLCHLMPQGGLIWLPIYFFTLVGAYLCGWRVGLLTAVLSPLANSLLFGMPAAAMLPIIIFKGVALALVASAVAYKKAGVATLWSLVGVVIGYQAVGILGEWAMTGSLYLALQDVRLGLPGLLAQIFAGSLIIRCLRPAISAQE